MGSYLLRRSLSLPLTILAISFAVFSLTSLLPGDPARLVVGPEASPEAYQAARAKLHLDSPWPLRFLDWLVGIARGDLGEALSRPRPVSSLIGPALAVTLPLALLSLLVAAALALPAGVLAALRAGGIVDLSVMVTVQLGMAIPEFWLGILLVGVAAVDMGLLPAGGFPGWGAGWGALAHLLLPALALGLPRAAYLARFVRAALVEVLAAPYLQTARAKGLSEAAVVIRHGLRNALIPTVTAAGLSLGHLMAGALVVENLFYLPGLGRLALEAVMARDLPLLSGVGLAVAGMIVLLNTAVDLLYGAIDPRIRYR